MDTYCELPPAHIQYMYTASTFPLNKVMLSLFKPRYKVIL